VDAASAEDVEDRTGARHAEERGALEHVERLQLGAEREQPLRARRPAPARRDVQRRLAALVGGAELGAPRREQVDHVGITRRSTHRLVEWRPTALVRGARIGAAGEEQLGDRTVGHGVVEGRAPGRVAGVEPRAVVEQQRNRLDRAPRRRGHERRGAVGIRRVRVGAAREERAHQLEVIARCRVEERGVAGAIGQVDADAAGEQPQHDLALAGRRHRGEQAAAVTLGDARVGAEVEEQPDRVEAVVGRGVAERRHALVIGEIDPGAELGECPDHLDAVGGGGVVEGGGGARIAAVEVGAGRVEEVNDPCPSGLVRWIELLRAIVLTAQGRPRHRRPLRSALGIGLEARIQQQADDLGRADPRGERERVAEPGGPRRHQPWIAGAPDPRQLAADSLDVAALDGSEERVDHRQCGALARPAQERRSNERITRRSWCTYSPTEVTIRRAAPTLSPSRSATAHAG
jgi:hypothetical protein